MAGPDMPQSLSINTGISALNPHRQTSIGWFARRYSGIICLINADQSNPGCPVWAGLAAHLSSSSTSCNNRFCPSLRVNKLNEAMMMMMIGHGWHGHVWNVVTCVGKRAGWRARGTRAVWPELTSGCLLSPRSRMTYSYRYADAIAVSAEV